MVYVYSKVSVINSHLEKKLTTKEITDFLVDMGMDVKGEEILENENNDIELKIEITAEKYDLISTLGISRAINYFANFKKTMPKFIIEKAEKTEKVIVNKNLENVRPFTTCFLVSNLKLDEEKLSNLIDIQEKIHMSFGRNRKKAAIGIYPKKNIQFPIHFKAYEKKDINFRPLFSETKLSFEKILTQNEAGIKYKHLVKDLKTIPIFADSKNQILSMPPIINSFDMGVVKTTDTDLFVEVSGFNIELLDKLSKILAVEFYEMGATIKSLKVEYDYSDLKNYELNLNSKTHKISLNYINKLIGINLKENDIEKLLNKQMYNLINLEKKENDIILEIEIPPFKMDVWSVCDIADDLARAYGYNNILPKQSNIKSSGKTLKFSKFVKQIRNSLIGLGFLELYTYLLTNKKTQFENMGIEENKENFVELKNCVEQGTNMTRISILPEHLISLNINRKNSYPQKIFEVGMTIIPNKNKDTGAKNSEKLCVEIADSSSNYTKIKEVFNTINNLFDLNLKTQEENFTFLIEGRSAKILLNDICVGEIGEVAPKILSNFGLLTPISFLEIDLRLIFEIKNKI
jgi:phenylalanyl-tRNA synthetase beta chain